MYTKKYYGKLEINSEEMKLKMGVGWKWKYIGALAFGPMKIANPEAFKEKDAASNCFLIKRKWGKERINWPNNV